MTFLQSIRPALKIVPDVEKPRMPVPLRERFMYTLTGVGLFLFCCQIRLYGVHLKNEADPMALTRMIMASNRGSLMELGIGPIVTAGIIMQLLAGSKLLSYDQTDEEERQLYEGAQKLVGLMITVGQALAYVLSGMYGDIRDVGAGNAMMIILQMTVSGFVVLMLDELLQKGYGLTSGISLFIATNTCENILWQAFGPTTLQTARGPEFQGAILALFHLLYSRPDKFRAIRHAFFRQNAPNCTSLLATVFVAVVVIYFQGFKVELKVTNRGYSGPRTYDIKLFYTSNMPIILQSALVSNLHFFSQLLAKRFGGFLPVDMLGTWQDKDFGDGVPRSHPVGGLAYYVSAPRTIADLANDPFHAIFYITFILASCALFSRTWIEVSGSAPRDVARQLKEQGTQFTGMREDMARKLYLERYIPTAAAFGGMCIGALSVMADILGAIGSGTGILLAVTIIYQIFETVEREAIRNGQGVMAMFQQ